MGAKMSEKPNEKTNDFVTRDSGERQVYPTGMVRDSGTKTLRPDLVDQDLLRRWSELMGRGAVKYGENNWKKAATQEELDRFRASAYRHFFQWYNGLETSEDHAAAVCFNIAGAEMVRRKLDEPTEIPPQHIFDPLRDSTVGADPFNCTPDCECNVPTGLDE